MDALEVIRWVARHHVETNGWPGIAYPIFISYEGQIYRTHDLEAMTYHCRDHNDHTLGICLEGSFINGEEPTDEQIIALRRVLEKLEESIGEFEVVGHKKLVNTRCPGDTFDGPNGWKYQLDEPQADWREKYLAAEAKLTQIKEIIA